jgi:hypothetical protein
MSNNNETNWHEREMNHMKDWKPYGIVEYITKEPIYVANPEFAFGIVRKMAAKNKLHYNNIVKFLQQHPAWNQVIFTVENMQNVNGSFLEQVRETGVLTQKRGSKETFKEHNIQFAIHGKGVAKVATMTEAGIKTVEVPLGVDLIVRGRGSPDRRPLLSMNIEGSTVRHKFLGEADAEPNLEANNDKLLRREAAWEDDDEVSEGSSTTLEATLSEDDDVIAMLLRGETLSNF